MIGKTITHYKIIEKLGEGGMGMVYKAEDLKLKRLVALKFISPVLTRHKEANERFIYEAQAASALDHQNIATIYEIDESDDGRMFISMAYYSGETLRERISLEQLSISKALDIAVQIAEGLSKAHRKGIIHKDIKPANVLVDEEGNVKIIDFGLAELLTTYNTAKTGSTKGTVAYMPPEQITGKKVDYRSDVWSLGVVVYEMLTGTRPFQGKYDQEIIFSILNETPEPVTSLRHEVQINLEKILMKALAKNPEKRYADMEKMLAALKNQAVKIQSQRFGDQEVLLKEKQIKSLAVLPLVNLSHDKEQEYFTDGMTDALITDLAKIGTLKVISRTSIMRYKSTDKSLPEIAEELNVDAIVEGTVLRIENRIQVNVQLIQAATDTHLWAETYEQNIQDIMLLQSELVKSIAKEIKVTINQLGKKQFTWERPVNPELYDNFLKGRFHFYKMSPEHFDKALEYFQFVLDKDPDFALAHVGIAQVWIVRPVWEVAPPKDSVEKARAAVSRALELDDSLEEAHCVVASIKFHYDWDWEGAEKEYRKTIRLNPNFADAHLFFATLLQALKRDEEAAEEVKRGLELDPIGHFSQVLFIGHLLHMRRYDEAIVKLTEIQRTEPHFPMAHRYLWICYSQKKMYDKALEEAGRYFTSVGENKIAGLWKTVENKNEYKEAMKLAAKKIEENVKDKYIRPLWIARLYSYSGDKINSLKWLTVALDKRDPHLVNLAVSRDWDNLRDEPQFRDLLRKLNLPYENTL